MFWVKVVGQLEFHLNLERKEKILTAIQMKFYEKKEKNIVRAWLLDLLLVRLWLLEPLIFLGCREEKNAI